MKNDTKLCRMCGRHNLLENFYTWKTGLSSYCKPCWRERCKQNALKQKASGKNPKPIRKYATEEEARIAKSEAIKRHWEKRKANPPSPTILVKQCSECQSIKSIEDFKKKLIGEHGLSGQCLDCLRAKGRQYNLRSRKDRWWVGLLSGAKRHAREKGRDFDLSADDVLGLYARQYGRCYWFGIDLVLTADRKHPMKPSLDRLDREKGYTLDNVVLACYSANIGRNEASAQLFSELVRQIKGTEHGYYDRGQA